MATLAQKILDSGDPFPDLAITLLNGKVVNLPSAVGPQYGVMLFYRGHW